jgi:acyl carrier protein
MNASNDPLIPRLKQLIISTLNLEDITPDDIAENAPLIGGPLSIDSIDALELITKVEKEFGLKITTSEETREALASVTALAAHIRVRAPGIAGAAGQ